MQKTKQEIYKNRPLSPHISIYKPQISSVLSIFHRLTGIALFFALSIMAWWLILWIFSGFADCYLVLAECCIVKFAIIGLSFTGFYHLCTGIRHLVWDTGRCFSIRAINITGWIAVICSIFMTIIFWLFVI